MLASTGKPRAGWSPDANWFRRFRRNVRKWYGAHTRELPWRRTRDPYVVWISEIMLQQTTVAAVAPYFARFIERFSTVEQLAAAAEDDVLKQWEGLGYYRRARNLHAAARTIVSKHGGEFPAEVDRLAELPGIGRYTAGAIASLAFDRCEPIVEANTLRFYCRLTGYCGDPRSNAGQRLLWEFARRILPRKQPGNFNQALMDLGADVCAAARPKCEDCPVRSCCTAFAEGSQNQIPRPARQPGVTTVVDAVAAVHRGGRYLVRQRRRGERWAGLWDFPRFCVQGPADWAPGGALLDGEPNGKLTTANRRNLPLRIQHRLAETTGLTVEIGEVFQEVRHGITRYRVRLLCYAGECTAGRLKANTGHRWVRTREMQSLAMPAASRSLAACLPGSGDLPFLNPQPAVG